MASEDGTGQSYKPPGDNCFAFTVIHVSDLDRAQKFFTDVFGWKFRTPGPRIFMTGGDVMGTLSLKPVPAAGEDRKPHGHGAVNYIKVQNIDDSIAKLVEAGGKVVKAKWTEGNHTELAEFEDTEGNLHGLLHWLI